MNTSEKILHQKFVNYGTNAKHWFKKCTLLLPEIEKQDIWQKKGFGSIHDYALKIAGMSHETVNDALRILKTTADMPAMRKVIEQKGINVVKPILTLLTKENEGFWAEKAMVMSRHTLETYVREVHKIEPTEPEAEGLFASSSPAIGRTGPSENAENQQEKAIQILDHEGHQAAVSNHSTSDNQPIKKVVGMELEAEVLEQLKKLKGDSTWNELLKQLLKEREDQLEAQKPEVVRTGAHPGTRATSGAGRLAKTTENTTSKAVIGATSGSRTGKASRHIPAKIKKFVKKRTNGVCAYPGCTTKIIIIHHTARWALKQEHDSDRMEGLCKAHERMVHLGLVENEDQAAKNWHIRLEPDKQNPKYAIDEMVNKYRTPK